MDALVRRLSRNREEPVWKTEVFPGRKLARQRERSYRSTPQDENCLKAQMRYLWTFEGEYIAGIIDTFCRLLTANGKRLYNPRTHRTVEDLYDIGDLALCDKFRFLEYNGFKGIPRYDFKFVRDCIAHQNVFVVSDSSILIPRNGRNIEMRNSACDKDEIDIDIKQKELHEFVDEMDGKLANLIIKYS